jgi:hypothetical protein
MPSEVLLTIWMINFSIGPRTSITIICVCAQAGLETESATEIHQEKKELNITQTSLFSWSFLRRLLICSERKTLLNGGLISSSEQG